MKPVCDQTGTRSRARDRGLTGARSMAELPSRTVRGPQPVAPQSLGRAVRACRRERPLLLLLDYDGTLVPLRDRPEAAEPDAELQRLLAAAGAASGVAVHVVSGRPPAVLDRWLGAAPVGLYAEYAAWFRRRGSMTWEGPAVPLDRLLESVHDLCAAYAAETPGALVERKTLGLAWHYRRVEGLEGARQARALERDLRTLLHGSGLEVLRAKAVVEVHPRGIDKGAAAAHVRASAPPQALIVAIGDDRIDEDMFAALGTEAVTIHVGPGATRARYRLSSVTATRAFLWTLISG